jgi:hypothetical protein
LLMRCGAGAPGPGPRCKQRLPDRPFLGRHPGDRICAAAPAAVRGVDHLQHGPEGAGVQLLRRERLLVIGRFLGLGFGRSTTAIRIDQGRWIRP